MFYIVYGLLTTDNSFCPVCIWSPEIVLVQSCVDIDEWTRSRASGPPTFSCMAINIKAVGGRGLISLASQSANQL